MNKAENAAYAYLKHRYSDVVYEPDGNIPPDFLVDRQLAVEVRTLNDSYSSEGDQIRITHAVSMALKEFDRPAEDQTYWVTLCLSGPLTSLRQVKSRLRQELRQFLNGSRQNSHAIRLTDSVALALRKSSVPHRQTFRIANLKDNEAGAGIADLYRNNIRHCIEEKTKKVAAYRDRYSRWWLILIDYLCGLFPNDPDDATEIEFVKRSSRKPSVWEKILVVDPCSNTELLQF